MRAGAFAVDFTGDVLAEVGNVDFRQLKYDVIATGWRQPGSTFKIFTYGGLVERLTKEVACRRTAVRSIEAIAASVLERCTVLDAPVFVPLGRGRGVKKIENFHSRSEPEYRGEINCRIALGESRNTAAMRAGARAGIRNVIELAYRVGLPKDAKHPLQPYPTTAIGASDVNPLAMASTAAFLNGGFRVTPRFANDVCREGKSLLYTDELGAAKDCDVKGENPRPQEHVMHPAVAAAMTELLKSPLDIGPTGTAASLRTGVIPGMDPLGDAIWKLKPDERKKRTLAFPLEQAGEIAGKTGTATNADGKTSDVWLLLFVPGPPRSSGPGHRARLLDGQGLEGSSARQPRLDGRPGLRRVGCAQLGAFGRDRARVPAEGARPVATGAPLSAARPRRSTGAPRRGEAEASAARGGRRSERRRAGRSVSAGKMNRAPLRTLRTRRIASAIPALGVVASAIIGRCRT